MGERSEMNLLDFSYQKQKFGEKNWVKILQPNLLKFRPYYSGQEAPYEVT